MDTPTPDPAPDATREPLRPRRWPLIIAGGAAALAAGLGGAWMLSRPNHDAAVAPAAAEGGLVIDTAADDGGRIDAAKPLRCFVQGQFVGELTLADCARRNGVATDALDVGLDASGALTAADQMAPNLAPLPPPASETQAAPSVAGDAPVIGLEDVATCQRYGGGRWRQVGGDMSLDACAQALFNGRCERPGAADYGRWGDQTLRLVTGRVEISDDDEFFRRLAGQTSDCTLEPIG